MRRDSGLDELLQEYFQLLYTFDGISSVDCLQHIRPMVLATDNNLLIAPFTEVETKDTVFSMHPDKSPGWDEPYLLSGLLAYSESGRMCCMYVLYFPMCSPPRVK